MVQGAQRPIGLISCKFLVSGIKLLRKYSSGFCCQGFDDFSAVKIIVVPRGTNAHSITTNFPKANAAGGEYEKVLIRSKSRVVCIKKKTH